MNDDDLNISGKARHMLEDIHTLSEDPAAAINQAQRDIEGNPGNIRAYRALAAALRQLGRHEEAGRADTSAVQASARSAPLLEAARAMRDRQVARAEQLLRAYLAADPDDPQALRMLAEIAAVCGHGGEAERLLRKALKAAPGFAPLYVNLAALLQDLGRTDEALTLLDQVLASDRANGMLLSFKAGILMGAGRPGEALETQERLLACAPDMATGWANYADTLKALGRADDAVSAYRTSLRLDPTSGFAWWGLANLRTTKLDQQDSGAIGKALAGAPGTLNRIQLHFALGKALSDQSRFAESFRHYATANEIRRTFIPYDPQWIGGTVRKTQAVFTREFVQQRTGQGCPATDPIFIVGLPRAGSTLVEQILASHPGVEGAGELFELDRIAMSLPGRGDGQSAWLDAIGSLTAEALHALGERYLAATRVHRKMDRPFFTDKMPFNWLYVGLISLILPNARIIDVRRHPMGCCFSNFTLYFNRTTNFASSLEDLGAYYWAYVQAMAHFDRAVPGRIYRVIYEDLVGDPAGEVRKLLAHLGLPFDEACLRFYENPRAVHTPSAQQVRRPINRDGLEYWRHFEPWLDPLKDALGPVLDSYPVVPGEYG